MSKTFNISEFVKYLNIEGTKNNPVQIIKYHDYPKLRLKSEPVSFDFYMLAIKWGVETNLNNAPPDYDLNDAFLYVEKPNGTVQWDIAKPFSGYNILLGSDLFNKSAFSGIYPDYTSHDALFLTKKEEILLKDIFMKTYAEYQEADFSTEIIMAYVRLILSYANKFYERQFKTRNLDNNKIVAEFYQNLKAYYNDHSEFIPLPNVAKFAEKSNHSPNYFGDIIKHSTGKSPLEIIHEHIIAIAKDRLQNSDLTVSEIGYSLGFEYPTYFTRFFKNKTGITPNNFRNQ